MHRDDDDDDLIALLDEYTDDSDDILDRTAPVDRLAPAFAAHHRTQRDALKRALVPVVHHTIQFHAAARDDILPARTHALARIADATLLFDHAIRRSTDAVQTVQDDTKAGRSLDTLFSTLDDLVRDSDRLFLTFTASMHDHVQRLRHCTDQMPVDAQSLLARLDNKAKHLGAQDHAKAKENLLRGILEKY